MKIDLRYKKIGSRKRAQSRYYMILNRTTNTETKKNLCYEGVQVLMTQDEFIEWFMPRDFEGCSVDRIDSSGHYEISNLQLLTLGDNIAKDKIKAKDGLCECYACFEIKPVEDFVRASRTPSGYTTICKACENIRTKLKYKRKVEKALLEGSTGV